VKVPELISDRLELKPLTRKHCSIQYVEWLNDPDVYRYLEVEGKYDIDKLDSYLKDVELRDIYFWAIHLKNIGRHIGNIKIDPISYRHGVGEYGILIGDRSAWGKGYAKEASDSVLKYCFDKLKLRKITLGVVANNHTAVKLYEDLNFIREGVFKSQGIWGGELCDLYRMAIFNPNYTSDL